MAKLQDVAVKNNNNKQTNKCLSCDSISLDILDNVSLDSCAQHENIMTGLLSNFDTQKHYRGYTSIMFLLCKKTAICCLTELEGPFVAVLTTIVFIGL